MFSTSDVLDHHLKSFASYDLDGVLNDYSSNAVLFTPTGSLKGPDAIRPLFQTLISEFAKPGSSFTMQQRCIEGDHAYILWTAETADNSYEFATDTFVVRNGENSSPILCCQDQTEALNSHSSGPCACIAAE